MDLTSIDNIDFGKFISNLGIIFMILLLLYYFIIMIHNLLKPYSFGEMGGKFDKNYFGNTFGFEGSDHFDFIINIRTDDASDDCKIRGRYKNKGLNKINIEGKGPKCSDLRSNNKL